MSVALLLRPSSACLGRVLQRLASTTASTQQLAEPVLGQSRPLTEIPGPRAYPILGSIPSIMLDKNFDVKRMHKFWTSLLKRYGPIVRLVNPGMGTMVGVINPEDCEKINRVSMNLPQRTPLASLKYLRDNWTDNYFEKRGGIIVEMSVTLLLLRPSSAYLGRVLQRLASTTASTQQLAEAVLEPRPLTEIPGPRVYPIVGSVPSTMLDKNFDNKRMYKYWRSAMKRYGPIMRLVLPGIGTMVAISNPEDCEKINRVTMDQPDRTPVASLKHVRDNWTDNYFEKRAGIIVENGEEWWRVRSRVQTAMLKPMVMREYLGEMDEVTLTFMDRIQDLQDKHGQMPDNFQEELYKWALESVGVVALDRRLGCLGAPEGSEAARRGEELIEVVNNLFSSLYVMEMQTQLWRLFPTPSYRKLRDNHEKLLKLVTGQVAETVAMVREGKAEGGEEVPGPRQHSVILKLLSTPGLTQKDVLTFIMDIIFAGIDTTSHTMAFCLYLLARNPEVQRKLQKEVDKVLGGLQGPLTPQHLARLSYGKAVIKETFRIFPLTGAFVRVLKEDLVLKGYKIPAGTSVLAVQALTGWDASVFPRPDEFLPERWLRDRPLGDIHPFAILPFGAGPRMCVGRRVAEQEMYTLLARVAQRFTVEYHHEDLEQLTGLVSYPSRPLRFTFIPRQ